MKIVVNNEAEKVLLEKLINTINDLDLFGEIERIDKETGNEPILTRRELKILREEFFCGSLSVVVDSKEQEISVENDLTTGTCVVCGAETVGVGPDSYDQVSYRDYLKLMSPEEQGKWKCDACERNTCPECGEAQCLPDVDMCLGCYEEYLEQAEYICPDCGEKHSRKQWLEKTAAGYDSKITDLVAPEHFDGQGASFICPGCGHHIMGRDLKKLNNIERGVNNE